MLFDGINTLVLPSHLAGIVGTTQRATILGLITFVGLILGMLVQPVAGVLSDRLWYRWGRRGTIAIATPFVLASLAVFGISTTVLAALLGYLMIQVSASTAQAAQQGFIPDLVPSEERGKAAGLREFADLGGALLGFLVLGLLLSGGQIRLATSAIALTVLASLFLVFVLVRESSHNGTAIPSKIISLSFFRVDMKEHRVFVRLVVSRFLFLLGLFAIGRFFFFFVADRLGLGLGNAARVAGTLLAILTLISALAAPVAGWASDRFGRLRLMYLGSILGAFGASLLILARSSLQILMFGGVMATGSAAFAVANWALTTNSIPQNEAARFLGIANFGKAGAAAVAGLLGPLVDWGNSLGSGIGYSVLFSISALAFLASGLASRGPLHLTND